MSILARSGNLSAAKILHNRVYMLFDIEDKARETQMELVLFDDTAFLNGDKLYYIYYDKLLRSVNYNFGKGDAHCAGSLNFSADFLTLSGVISGADGIPHHVLGYTTKTIFDALLTDPAGNKKEIQLTVGATTDFVDADLLLANPMPRALYFLNGVDISLSTTCISVDPVKWETTIIKNKVIGGFGDYDNVSFSIVVDFRGTSFVGKYVENDPVQGPITYGFNGKATAGSLLANHAVDRNWRSNDSVPLDHCPHPARISAQMREEMPLAAEPTLLELLNINPIEIVISGGKEYPIDHAQQTAMGYFQNILVGYLENETIHDFFGCKPTLSTRVQAISDKYRDFYKEYATTNMAQILYDNCRNSASKEQNKACERIKIDVVKSRWSKASSDNPSYQPQANALYLEGYRDGVQSIQVYLTKGEWWAQELANYLKSDAFINMFRVQIASLAIDNIQSRIRSFYSKLVVLDGSEDGQLRAKEITDLLVSCVLTVGGTLSVYTPDAEKELKELLIMEIEQVTKDPSQLPTTIKELAVLYQSIVETYGSIHVFAGTLFNELRKLAQSTAAAGNSSIVSLLPLAGDSMANQNSKFSNIWNQAGKANVCRLIGSTLMVAGAAFMIYNIVNVGQKDKLTPEEIVLELSLGEVALMMLIKGGKFIMESKIGGWISGKLSSSQSRFAKFAEGFSKWFTKEGVASDCIFAKLFGKNSQTFFKKFLGPAMLMTAIILGSLALDEAVKHGETREIVLEALNIVALSGELICLGFAICGFSWAGPLGIAFAVIGGIVLAIQLIWSLIVPPKGPVERYIDKKLVPVGLAAA